MDHQDFLAERFEQHRSRLNSVAYRMLGSLSEAEDAVQEAWLRLTRTGDDSIDDLAAWLTTVVGRICLDMLRSRTSRREDPLLPERLPDPVVTAEPADPEQQAELADTVGYAMLVVLQQLAPAERLAFVLHDMFAVPFEEIAPVVERSVPATRQLASRGRRRVKDSTVEPDPDPVAQRMAVDAFLSAARGGDTDALLNMLDPDLELRNDDGVHPLRVLSGAARIARSAIGFHREFGPIVAVPVLVNGAAGILDMTGGKPRALTSYTISGGRVRHFDIISDAERLASLLPADLTA
ncbi:sigma-70 family RNA polymerase sigma factor [Nocardiopsis sp. RSe5-2]|uniref:Sigma-70 family RNA polymerase sigma factor n=1 Tax=Nocardiopsis endophytica TaxID=3018445 RepID=A0ABT4U616_9ACTN|nr:sigma-70 family RNA polymerase sigma factor [Nocardiopsis endophytica]MDA2812386.1 sigma-70 family RNA polymerase sigma factor [Nocardiopsis endophytica]